MLSWKINNNVISELVIGNQNIINPWGFETADSSAFFSLEKGVGWRNEKLVEEYKYDNKKYKATIIAKMQEGKWKLCVDDNIQNNTIMRKVEIETMEDSIFMDFVMRFRFKKEVIEYADIAGHRYTHNDTNIYYQYSTDNVSLKAKNFNIKISIIDAVVPDKMEPVIYVRDNKNEWVVHVRMTPRSWDKEVIKICTAWAGTRPLPQMISNFILKNRRIKEALWYRGERRPFNNRFIRRFLNPAAFGMVKVPKKQNLMWKVKMEVI